MTSTQTTTERDLLNQLGEHLHKKDVHLNPIREGNLPPNLDFVAIYHELILLIENNLASMPGESTNSILAYLKERLQHLQKIKQDLLPLLVYVGVSECSYKDAIPLAASWTLGLAAAHLLDDAQDNDNISSANGAVAALGAANIILINAPINKVALLDILEAFGRVTIIGTNAQAEEKKNAHLLSRTKYFQSIIGKAAVILATGVWVGGRLATDDPYILSLLKEFGLAWGMANQISDDCVDLAEDLSNGLFTLPIIEGLALIGHPQYPYLDQAIGKTNLNEQEIQMILRTLESMGAIAACQQLSRAYQVQAAAIFDFLPGLKPFF